MPKAWRLRTTITEGQAKPLTNVNEVTAWPPLAGWATQLRERGRKEATRALLTRRRRSWCSRSVEPSQLSEMMGAVMSWAAAFGGAPHTTSRCPNGGGAAGTVRRAPRQSSQASSCGWPTAGWGVAWVCALPQLSVGYLLIYSHLTRRLLIVWGCLDGRLCFSSSNPYGTTVLHLSVRTLLRRHESGVHGRHEWGVIFTLLNRFKASSIHRH